MSDLLKALEAGGYNVAPYATPDLRRQELKPAPAPEPPESGHFASCYLCGIDFNRFPEALIHRSRVHDYVISFCLPCRDIYLDK